MFFVLAVFLFFCSFLFFKNQITPLSQDLISATATPTAFQEKVTEIHHITVSFGATR